MTETKLKPCPFCGGEAEFYSDEFGVGVCCKTCGAILRNDEYGKYIASVDWNTRPIEDEKAAEIKRLREELAKKIEPFEGDWKDSLICREECGL